MAAAERADDPVSSRNLQEQAARRLRSRRPLRAIDAIEAGDASASGLPDPWNESVRSFYDLLADPEVERHCIGTACTFARAGSQDFSTAAVRCLGRCYEAPADSRTAGAAIPRRSLARRPVVLRHLLSASSPPPWTDYELPAGDAVLEAIERSGLRGRGGAAFPTAAKWRAARETAAPRRYVVANGDEGDPGAYVDRLLLEEAPHSILAGMLACARVIGATHGIVYVRGEYPVAAERMREAIAEAGARGVLGDFRVEVVRGAGSYVAGEETALLRSIEGFRAEPAPKPPYPATCGLHGLPTVGQNGETLASGPGVVREGRRGGTKAVWLSGAVRRPGVVEADLGIPLRKLLEEGGGGAPEGTRWRMALVGGPLGRIVPASDFDVELSFEALPGLGHAGIVAFDERTSVRALAEHLFEFARGESCGSCTPCRIGTGHLATRRTRAELERLLLTLEQGSLCGFGQGVPRPLRDLLRAFGDEVLA